jgi:L-arabinose isomerase
MDQGFGHDVDPDRLMFNHGIHGVMDLTSLLKRHEKVFWIVAGHFRDPEFLRRVEGVAKAGQAAKLLRQTRVLKLGKTFRGMGDFAVSSELLKQRFGIVVEEAEPSVLEPCAEGISDEEISQETARDQELFECRLSEEAHRRSVRVGLALRKLLDQGAYSALTLNFSSFDDVQSPADTVPFLEVSKAMARGIGYAGEGDVLTASLIGALNRAFGHTTFAEIFCPDWEGETLFLSHMGEINPGIAATKPLLIQKPLPFLNSRDPAILTCCPRPGPAIYVNLAPQSAGRFALVLAEMDVLEDSRNPEFVNLIRGWIKPHCGVPHFLEMHSRFGATHHSALVLGEEKEALMAFADFLGVECYLIE